MKENSTYRFVKVGNGRLSLNHRPRGVDFPHLRELGCTHVVTLLKESEHAERIRALTEASGMTWFWLPVPNGNYPEGMVHERMLAAMPQLSHLLDEGRSLLIHCSAGIHRTGTVAYGLLRWRGLDREEAMQIISEIRKETAEGMLEKRMRWGNENARQVSFGGSWLENIRNFLKHLVS
ncbi:MAG TPA: tyrosine-protein phosphatase [Anaerolineales bacterium]|nr:tyrosine-protein phosphatase [Anaerolineales bacterium]HNN12698.1 tyrosine-protein phosphatase [Anaerolineales bacterium]HNO31663.1 tyrosine-protein phosphatase [Anaerolineales bacterium]